MISGLSPADLTVELDSAPIAPASGLLKCRLNLSEPKLLYGDTGKYYMKGSYEVL